MFINLVESISKNLGYSDIQLVDPNSQDVKTGNKSFGLQSLVQGGIPSVICGLYNYTRSVEGVDDIANGNHPEGWFKTIFGDKSDELAHHVADYAGTAMDSTTTEMEHISNEAVRAVRQAVASGKATDAGALLSDERNNTLLYLPASLHIGEILGNNNLDDQTHKMQGPVSSFLQNIEKHFNSNSNA